MVNENDNLLPGPRAEHFRKKQPSAAKNAPVKGTRLEAHEGLPEQYHDYYDRFYPLVKDNRLDFHRIAEKTRLKERRLREALLFRLSTGEVMQLFGCRAGFCYICECKMQDTSNKEPVCITCLKILDTAIQELYMADMARQQSSLGDPVTEATPFGLAELHEEIQEEQAVPGFSPALDFEPEPTPGQEYEQLVSELKRYRKLFGPLPSLETPPPPHQEPASIIDPLPEPEEVATVFTADSSEAPAKTVSDIEPLLEILALDDRDVPRESIDIGALPLLSKEPVRHFGFERLKGGNA